MVSDLALLYELLVLKLILNLRHNCHKEARRRCRNDSVHHNLVWTLVVHRDAERGTGVHEQRCDQDDKCAREEHADVGCVKNSVAVVSIHFEDDKYLRTRQSIKLWKLLSKSQDVLVPHILLLMPLFLKVIL